MSETTRNIVLDLLSDWGRLRASERPARLDKLLAAARETERTALSDQIAKLKTRLLAAHRQLALASEGPNQFNSDAELARVRADERAKVLDELRDALKKCCHLDEYDTPYITVDAALQVIACLREKKP